MITVNYPHNKPYAPVKPEPQNFRLTNSTGKTVIYYDVELNGDSEFNLDEYFEEQEEPRTIPKIRYWQKLSSLKKEDPCL